MKSKINTSDLPKYAVNFSGSKFWSKLIAVAKQLGEKILRLVLLLYYTLKSAGVSPKDKAIILGALGYLILPLDLIPDWILVIGLTDDIAAIKLAYDVVKASITPEIERKAGAKLAQIFGKRWTTPADIIDELKTRPGI